jgi:erythromycin esterase
MNFIIIRNLKLLLCLFCFNSFYGGAVYAQILIKAYVAEKSVAINTIEPDSTNYSDLEPIGHAIGNDRVVM